MSDKIFIYTALACEAKPLIEFFHLKKDLNIAPFAVYNHDNLYLTVTGLGKTAMAAAIAYTQALFISEYPILINIGIAGHKNYPLGALYWVNKIIDNETQKSVYPPLITKAICPTAAIRTSSTPQLNYDHNDLCDMEASAFYEIATRFTSAELCQCLKIISDNQATPATQINAKQVSQLITTQLSQIAQFIKRLSELIEQLPKPDNALFEQINQCYHFTASSKQQLKALLAQWIVLTDNQVLPTIEPSCQTSKDVLKWLEQQIKQIEFYL